MIEATRFVDTDGYSITVDASALLLSKRCGREHRRVKRIPLVKLDPDFAVVVGPSIDTMAGTGLVAIVVAAAYCSHRFGLELPEAIVGVMISLFLSGGLLLLRRHRKHIYVMFRGIHPLTIIGSENQQDELKVFARVVAERIRAVRNANQEIR